jgi:glycosyltransferase involved in cell wall biosynthesis
MMAKYFVLPLVEYERSQGYESRVVTSVLGLNDSQGIVIPFDLNFRNFLILPFSLVKICRYLFFYRPELVISHNFKSSLLPLLAAKVMGVSSRIYFNHGVPYVGYSGLLRNFLMLLESANMKLATEVVTVSEDMKALLLRINSNKIISLIGNGSACGLDLLKYLPNKFSHKDFLRKYGLDDSDHIITFVGRPEIRKGFLVALTLWESYFHSKKTHKLFLCGPTEQDVKRLFGRVPSNVFCLGFTENIPEILSSSSCLILPSFHEGLSYAVLEAMASKCIVIANDVDGICNLVSNGVNGFLIKDNSIEQYAEIISLVDNASLAEKSRIKEEALKTAELYSRGLFLELYGIYLKKFF